MPGSVCFHFYGDPANYFTYPSEVNPFPGLKHCYETLSWSWQERIHRVTINGLYLAPLNSNNATVYQAYIEELASMHPIYQGYAHALEDETEGDWVLPVGCLVALNHWGILQICILQCPAFRLSDDDHLAYTRGRVGRQYACPQRGKLVEALADALFEYAHRCHTYAEMSPVRAFMENALQHLEYALFVFLTLRRREVRLTDPHLKDLYRPTLLTAYKHIRRELAEAAAPAGVSGDALLAEARRVFSLTDTEQRAYFCRLYAELSPQEAVEPDAIRHRYTTILRGMR